MPISAIGQFLLLPLQLLVQSLDFLFDLLQCLLSLSGTADVVGSQAFDLISRALSGRRDDGARLLALSTKGELIAQAEPADLRSERTRTHVQNYLAAFGLLIPDTVDAGSLSRRVLRFVLSKNRLYATQLRLTVNSLVVSALKFVGIKLLTSVNNSTQLTV